MVRRSSPYGHKGGAAGGRDVSARRNQVRALATEDRCPPGVRKAAQREEVGWGAGELQRLEPHVMPPKAQAEWDLRVRHRHAPVEATSSPPGGLAGRARCRHSPGGHARDGARGVEEKGSHPCVLGRVAGRRRRRGRGRGKGGSRLVLPVGEHRLRGHLQLEGLDQGGDLGVDLGVVTGGLGPAGVRRRGPPRT